MSRTRAEDYTLVLEAGPASYTPEDRRAVMEKSAWTSEEPDRDEEAYDGSVFDTKDKLLEQCLNDAKAERDPQLAYRKLREDLGYQPKISEEDSKALIGELGAWPERGPGGELTAERLTGLALAGAEKLDAEAVELMAIRIDDPEENGWHIHHTLVAATKLREGALEGFVNSDRAALEGLNTQFGLDVHNITDEAAARGATYWNNDPPGPMADEEEIGLYVKYRMDAWITEIGLDLYATDRADFQESLADFARELATAYQWDEPKAASAIDAIQGTLQQNLDWTFDDVSPGGQPTPYPSVTLTFPLLRG